MGFNSGFKGLNFYNSSFKRVEQFKYLGTTLTNNYFFISFICTLSPLWDYQYKYDIVHITLSVETQHDESCSSKLSPLYQYKCDIVYITLSVETQHDESCSSKHSPLYQYNYDIVHITLSVETQHDESCSSKHSPLYQYNYDIVYINTLHSINTSMILSI